MIIDLNYVALYTISNELNDKIYVGVTSDPNRRFKHHMVSAFEKYPSGKFKYIRQFPSDIRKLGPKSFKLNILNCGTPYLISIEEKLLTKSIANNILYNSMQGGTYFNKFRTPEELSALTLEYKTNGILKLKQNSLFGRFIHLLKESGVNENLVKKLKLESTEFHREKRLKVECNKRASDFKLLNSVWKTHGIEKLLKYKYSSRNESGYRRLRTLLTSGSLSNNIKCSELKIDRARYKLKLKELKRK